MLKYTQPLISTNFLVLFTLEVGTKSKEEFFAFNWINDSLSTGVGDSDGGDLWWWLVVVVVLLVGVVTRLQTPPRS